MVSKLVKDLYGHFEREDLLDDRREYTVEDLMAGYPELTESEAKELFDMIQKWWWGGEEAFDSITLVCPECKEKFRADELGDRPGIYFGYCSCGEMYYYTKATKKLVQQTVRRKDRK